MMTDPDFKTAVAEREKLFIDLYKRVFPLVARYVSRMGGDLEQAKDVFQDALVAYYERTRQEGFELNSGEKAYIFGIAKHLWIKRYKESRGSSPLSDHMITRADEPGLPSTPRILRYLEAAGQKCMALLKAFYYEQQKLEEIAGAFGFSGTRSATVQKFKCLEKVREKIKEKALTYEDFLE